MLHESETIQAHINGLVDAEVRAYDTSLPVNQATLADFMRLRVRNPAKISVQFSGAIIQKCWTVTRSNGSYQVIYLPTADYFSLCVNSDFGPLDIGVHGSALNCFASV
ncbi:hypothetical protein [Pseudoprimorskyibacter insulae]|uniref:Uncharacterized protein n=1 Tax=Pseudoprimorskyibacter insulae TaxID=1695997 RepID=A0A2R8B150_9RHOB|nr:hypothetical protein [Pseudoprimorskyibacter insulae]SPF81894.1 hypothetical protein PRI8871_03720 [Pseudoprimorskyibacter insulae]